MSEPVRPDLALYLAQLREISLRVRDVLGPLVRSEGFKELMEVARRAAEIHRATEEVRVQASSLTWGGHRPEVDEAVSAARGPRRTPGFIPPRRR